LSLVVTAHLAFKPNINGSNASLDKSKLPRQANITANYPSRDYRRTREPPFAWL